MFEITDEFLEQAGFSQLPDAYKKQLREQASDSVQQKIGERVAEAVGEERAQELGRLIDGDPQTVHTVAERIDSNYRESDDFKAVERLGRDNAASDEEIVQQYVVLAWFKEQGIDIAAIVQQSMNDVMSELQQLRKVAHDTVQ